MYDRNAVSCPIIRAPASMRSAPNHSTATVVAFSTSMTVGNISAMSLPTRSEVS